MEGLQNKLDLSFRENGRKCFDTEQRKETNACRGKKKDDEGNIR